MYRRESLKRHPTYDDSSFPLNETIMSEDGVDYQASEMTPADVLEVSLMIERNFRHASSYQHLPPETRDRYIAANSPKELLETISHPDNIACLIIKDAQGQIVGFRVVRKGIHKARKNEHDEPLIVAEGRRMHIALDMQKKGLGTKLLQLSEKVAKQKGHKIMVINSSGDSYHFFLKTGYTVLAHTSNETLQKEGITAGLVYMEKFI